MKDFFGHPIALGDKVAAVRAGYRDFVFGTVTSFTAKQVRVDLHNEPTYRPQETIRYPHALIVQRK